MSTPLPDDNDGRGDMPSASSMARTLACPGWINASRGMTVTLPEKSWTKDGTLGHDVLAGEADEEELDGKEDLQHAVRTCEEKLAMLRVELDFNEPQHEIREQRFYIHDDQGNPVASGKPDRVYIEGRRMFIPDFKLGRKDVIPPANNPQLIAYAIALAEEHDIDEAVLAIVPAWRRTPPAAIITREGIALWRMTILAAVADTKKPDAPRRPGSWCDYCPARAICPEAHAVVRVASEIVTTDIVGPEEDLRRYDIAQHAKKTIEVFLEYFGMRFDENPEAYPGVRRKKGSEVVTIADSAAVYNELAHELGHERLISCAKLSFPSVASVASGGKPSVKKLSKEGEAKKAELRERLAPFLKVTEKRGSLERMGGGR